MAAHLAAYLKIPVVTLFGSQDPKLTSPIAEKAWSLLLKRYAAINGNTGDFVVNV